MSTTEFKITLPVCSRHPAPENTITTRGPLVIVGANGTGKSRLAAWLEKHELVRSHRVSAQRTLSFPDDFLGANNEKAKGDFLYGHRTFTVKNAGNKFAHRWENKHDGLLRRDLETTLVELEKQTQDSTNVWQDMMRSRGGVIPEFQRHHPVNPSSRCFPYAPDRAAINGNAFLP
jgi:hypothetical protein